MSMRRAQHPLSVYFLLSLFCVLISGQQTAASARAGIREEGARPAPVSSSKQRRSHACSNAVAHSENAGQEEKKGSRA